MWTFSDIEKQKYLDKQVSITTKRNLLTNNSPKEYDCEHLRVELLNYVTELAFGRVELLAFLVLLVRILAVLRVHEVF